MRDKSKKLTVINTGSERFKGLTEKEIQRLVSARTNLFNGGDGSIGGGLSGEYLSSEKYDEAKGVINFLEGLMIDGRLVDKLLREKDNEGISDTNIMTSSRVAKELSRHDDKYLRKDKDDRSSGIISSNKGFEVGRYVSGASGAIVYVDNETGHTVGELDKLYVRMKAYFETLEIINVNSVGGKQIISPGGAMHCVGVEEVEDSYRCYFLAEQDGEIVDQRFRAGDQMYCKNFNAFVGVGNKISNKYYWRLVDNVSKDYVEYNGKNCYYVDLSMSVCDADSDIPEPGDIICQRGNISDVDRQNFIEFSSVDSFSPSITLYQGVGGKLNTSSKEWVSDYSLVGKDVVQFGVNKITGKAFMNVYGDMYVGDRNTGNKEPNSYLKYTQEEGLEIKGKLSVGTSIGGKDLSNFVTDVLDDIKNLQDQIDGVIESFFDDYEPTLNNLPASEWIASGTEKEHINDTFTNTIDGRSWRWSKTKDEFGYGWVEIRDSAATEALRIAMQAKDTADKKRRVFVKTPYPPYDEGDLWAGGSDSPLKVCATSKKDNELFNEFDWVYADNTEKLRDEMSLLVGTTKSELNESIENTKAAMESYTDEAKDALQQSIDLLEETKAEVENVYTKADADGRISDAEANAIKKAEELAEAAKDLAETNVKAWADGEISDAEQRAIDEAQARVNKAKGELEKAIASIDTKYLNLVTETKAELNNAIGQATEAANTYTDTAKEALQASINELNEAKANITEVYSKSEADGKITASEQAAIDAAKKQAEAAIYFSEITVKAYADGIVDEEEAARIKQAEENLANAKQYAEEKATEAKDEIKNSYLFQALTEVPGTSIENGLILSSLIQLRDKSGNVKSGINGTINDSEGDKSIANWWGGIMDDITDYYEWNGTEWVTKNGVTVPNNLPSGLIRMDGTGYLAKGKFWWDNNGKIYADPTALFLMFDVEDESASLSQTILNLRDKQTEFTDMWELRTDGSGNKYLYSKRPLVTQGGVTMYANGGDINIPSIYDGLPIDGTTIYWENGILKAKGGGGIAESVSWNNITDKPSWLLDNKISYSEIADTPDLGIYVTETELTNKGYLTQHQDLSGYQKLITSSNKLAYSLISGTPTALKNPTALKFGTKSYDGSVEQTILASDLGALTSHQTIYTLTFQSGTFDSGSFTANSGNKTINIPTTTSHVSEGSNLYFTNARAVSALADTLKSYVTLSGTQTIRGEKNFTGGLKVNGSPIVYDAAKKYWKLEGDLLITGGLTMYGNDSSFTPSTIMDAIAANLDPNTLAIENGLLTVVGGGSGSISEITKQMVIDALGFTPISSSDMPTALPNPHSLKFGSKLYDGSASKTILASDLGITWDDILGRPTLLSSFTDDVVAGKYLPLSGGAITGEIKFNIADLTYKDISYGIIAAFKAPRVQINELISKYIYLGSDSEGDSSDTSLVIRKYSSITDKSPSGTTDLVTIDTSGNVTAIGGFTGNLTGTATKATTADSATYATSAGNAEKLAGYGLNRFLLMTGRDYTEMDLNTIGDSQSIFTEIRPSEITTTNSPHNGYGALLSLKDRSGIAKMQLLGSLDSSVLYFRSQQKAGASITSNWKTIAFTDSNVASASKLTDLSANDIALSSDIKRKIWMCYADATTGRPALSDNLTFQTSTNTLFATNFNGNLTGNASSATKLKTPRTIWGQSFDGTGDVSGSINLGENAIGYNLSDVWTDDEGNTHPWYGLDFSTPSKFATLSDWYGITLIVGGDRSVTIPYGNVGIGTTSPAYKLDVSGTGRFTGDVIINGNTAIHSGNIGSQSVAEATNAFYLKGGLYRGDLNDITLYGDKSFIKRIHDCNANIPNGFEYGNLLYISGSGDTSFMLLGDYVNQTLLYRSGINNKATMPSTIHTNSWKTIAFTDSNVASASNINNISPILVSANEQDEIKGIVCPSVNTTTGLNGIYANIHNGLDFRWHNSHWLIANNRSSDASSNGFGFWFSDSGNIYTMKAMISNNGIIYSSGGFSGELYGNALSATKLQTARTIFGQSFDGTGDVEGDSKANSFIATSSNGLRLAYGNYGTLLRNDGSGFFILLTNSGGALDGSFNTLRPFKIDLATGDIQMESNVFITKSFKLIKRLRVDTRESDASFGYLKSNIANRTNIGIAHLGTNYGGTNDITIEDFDMTAISMYRGIVGIGKEYDYTSLQAIYDAGVDLGLTKGLLIGSAKVLYVNNKLNISTSAYINGNILTTGGVTMYSQRNLKNITDERGLSLEELRTIKPTRYTWKDGRDDRIHIGGIADDIQQVLPEVVYNANGVLTMDYGNAGFAIASSLIKPVIDHEQRIKTLEKENEELKQEIKRLRA